MFPPLIGRIFIIRKVNIIKETESYNIFISDGWDSFLSVPYWTLGSPVFNSLLYKTWCFIEHSFVSFFFFFVLWVPSVGMGEVML